MLTRETLGELIDELAERPASKRGRVPGIKPDRGDVILGGALVLASAMEEGGFDAIEVTEAGLREGVFFERFLDGAHPPLMDDVRGAVGRQPRAPLRAERPHVRHVEQLSLELYDGLARRRLGRRLAEERELLCARVHAARHRRGRPLRRPPQALALPHPQQRRCPASTSARSS